MHETPIEYPDCYTLLRARLLRPCMALRCTPCSTWTLESGNRVWRNSFCTQFKWIRRLCPHCDVSKLAEWHSVSVVLRFPRHGLRLSLPRSSRRGRGVCQRTTDPSPWRVLCKILEHIIVRHFRTHLERHGILTPFNHGFRSKFSWETQLLLTLQDLLTFRDHKIQVDMAISDFSKAFDTVPHDHLLGKMEYVLRHTRPSIEMNCLLLEDQITISACAGKIF